MLIWVVIFNHKAESPTYVIAASGAAVWYFYRPTRDVWRHAMIAAVFAFTCLAATDIYPPYLKTHLMVPYVIKALPCILLWCAIEVELLFMQRSAPAR